MKCVLCTLESFSYKMCSKATTKNVRSKSPKQDNNNNNIIIIETNNKQKIGTALNIINTFSKVSDDIN